MGHDSIMVELISKFINCIWYDAMVIVFINRLSSELGGGERRREDLLTLNVLKINYIGVMVISLRIRMSKGSVYD